MKKLTSLNFKNIEVTPMGQFKPNKHLVSIEVILDSQFKKKKHTIESVD